MRMKLGKRIKQYTAIHKKAGICSIIFAGVLVAPLILSGCANEMASFEKTSPQDIRKNEAVENAKVNGNQVQLSERSCLMRAMYFESNRSSYEGMVSVGTVVMNRVNSSAFPKTICGVVGQKNQFAPGVLVRKMQEPSAILLAGKAADAVLHGKRSEKSKNSMFFHTAGLSFPYKNMHYVEVSGGNAFYEKRGRDGKLQVPVNDAPYNLAMTFADVVENNLQKKPVTDAIMTKPQEEVLNPSSNIKTSKHIIAQNQTILDDTIINKVPIPQPSPKTNTITFVSAKQEDPFKDMVLNYTVPSQKKIAKIGAILYKQRSNNI